MYCFLHTRHTRGLFGSETTAAAEAAFAGAVAGTCAGAAAGAVDRLEAVAPTDARVHAAALTNAIAGFGAGMLQCTVQTRFRDFVNARV